MRMRLLCSLAAIGCLTVSIGCSEVGTDGATGPAVTAHGPGSNDAPATSAALTFDAVVRDASLLVLQQQATPVPRDDCEQTLDDIADVFEDYLEDVERLATGSGEWCDITGATIDALTPLIQALDECEGRQADLAREIFDEMFDLWWDNC